MAGNVKTISVKREGRRWYVILTAGQTAPEPLPRTGSVAGIGMGTANFLADSGGEFVPNLRHGAKAAARLEEAQRALARVQAGQQVSAQGRGDGGAAAPQGSALSAWTTRTRPR
ncbi:hypothetical protein [Streptomyces sp. NBC_01320]|uniref:hypothetical protein n=1 Tax=Streptomyces sp. NBC_01320 TaxID=2903824 RepID=UPI002E10EC14